jgi:hypothetical protein
MSWSLDKPVRLNRIALVPIVDVVVAAKGDMLHLAAYGAKQPALFLVFRDGEVSGIDLAGHQFDTDELERMYPEAVARATASLAKDAD